LFLTGDVFTQETHADSTIRTFEAERIQYFRNEREFYAFDEFFQSIIKNSLFFQDQCNKFPHSTPVFSKKKAG